MIKAVGDKIFAEFKKTEAPSGIILPDYVKPKVEDEDAIIVSVGDEVTGINVGDRVIFNPQAALLVEVQGSNYILLTKKAILCVVEKENV
jgi:co-chaperonin GroES (HSP10)